MDDVAFARALHVLAVVHWLGGVAMVTLVLLPALRRLSSAADRLDAFEAIEGRFVTQVRWSVALAGLSGVWMTWRLDAWDRFLQPGYWWMHAMVLLWALFALVLYVGEPLILHAWLRRCAALDPEGTMVLLLRAHRVALAAAAVTILVAVLGAHGALY